MKKAKRHKKSPNPSKPGKKHEPIPLPLIHDDQQDLEQELQELFDEDRVTHQHGPTEPERD